MDVDTANISHDTVPPVIPNSSQIDRAPALADHVVHIPAAHTASSISDLASQLSTTAIPSKWSYHFGRDEARKKKKTRGYINVRIYAE